MQQRGINNSMEARSEEQVTLPQSRGRTNSKLKVLVRSHAMREEASPPRDPLLTSVISPCIKLIPSTNSSPAHSPSPTIINKPVVVLSPSISRGNSPCHSPPFVSPTSTLVASPNSRCSTQSVSPHPLETIECKRSQRGNYEMDCVADNSGCEELHRHGSPLHCNYNMQSVEETSHNNYGNKKRNDKNICDCTNQACTNCLRGHERNINNNLSSNINNNNNFVGSCNMLTVNRATRGKLRQQSSSQGSFENSSSNSPCLSRDSSSEQYTDTTGIDLEQFIAETLNRNGKDRALMLRIEQELVSLAKDKIRSHYKFPPMSSYQRMLVHRCAAYFGMDHNIESSGKCVVVNKTKCTRIPDIPFKEYVKDDIVFMEEPRRSILKRDSSSIEDYSYKSPDRQCGLENRRSKSIEEREEEYERAKRRIFNRDMQEFGSSEEFCWPEVPWSSTDSDCSSRYRLLHPEKHTGRLLKVQSVEAGTEMPRPCVAKSYSFGGYGGSHVLTRGDSVLSTHSAGPRLLTKQDSGASTVSWRLSPSSSGYKSQSQISESITPSPTSTPNLSGDSTRLDSANSNMSTSEAIISETEKDLTDSQLVWAVTDINNVPKGSVIINPQTCQPVKNVDGTVYHYDPQNLPNNLNIAANVKSLSTSESTLAPEKSLKAQISPKKQPLPSLSKRSNLINSSTSPSLPFSPIHQPTRTIQYSQSFENMPNLPVQQYHPVYSNNYNTIPAQDNSLPVYQQPYIMYASYGVSVPSQFEGRMDSQVQEIPTSFFIPDNSANQAPQPLPYQSGSFWNQQPVTVFQNPPPSTVPPNPQPSPQRFVVPLQTQAGSFVSPTYPQNFGSHFTQPIQNISQSSQNTDLMPLYTHQPMQVVYPSQPNHSNALLYPNHSIIYAQNPVYPNMVVPVQNIPQTVPYPHNSSTPNSYGSASTSYAAQIQDQGGHVPHIHNPVNYNQLAHSMSHLTVSSNQMANIVPNQNPFNQTVSVTHTAPQGDLRMQRSNSLKGNKFSIPKNIIGGSSQSSTGTSSPAATIIAGYCGGSNNQNVAAYRTPSETPPTQNVGFGYGPGLVSPMVIKQINNVHASPPVTRSSRSPTPASDISQMDRHRLSLPPNLLQGMPYVLSNDSRMVQNRGQSMACRQPLVRHQNFNQGGDSFNRAHKKKLRGSKNSGLPPSGK